MIITVSSFTFPADNIADGDYTLRFWYLQSFLDSTNQFIASGTGTTGTYFTFDATASSGVMTIDPMTIYSTLDANVPFPQSIQCMCRLYKRNSGLPVYPFNQVGVPATWVVPSSFGATMSFAQWTDYNQASTLAFPAETYPSTDLVARMIAESVDNAALNQDVVISSYSSFANAVSTIGSTATTLVINQAASVTANTTVPSTLTLKFTRKGSLTLSTGVTLTVQGPIEADAAQIFFNAQASQGTVSLTTRSLQEVYPEWWGASPSATAAVNTPAIQAAIIGAYGNTRTNGSGLWIYNRILKFSGIYSINDELNVYHMIGFRWEGQNKFNSGITQTAANKRIINGQSIAYGVFDQLYFSTSAAQIQTLIDLDYDGSQGSDLRPQNITFNDCVVQGNAVGYIGVQIAKSGGGAQGDNIRFYNCYINGFTQSAAQLGGGADGVATALAFNALDVQFNGGDIQSCPKYGLAAYGGNWLVDGTTFENSTTNGSTQTGFDILAVSSQVSCVAKNIRSESTRFSSGVAILDNVSVNPNVSSWYNSNGGGSLALTPLGVDQVMSGTSIGGDGKVYKVTVAGTLGGLGITAVSSAGASTLVVAGTPWSVNAYAGYKVSIITGTGAPPSDPFGLSGDGAQSILISSNTNNTLTLASPWTTIPDATSTFVIEPNWGTQTTSGSVTFALMDYVVAGGVIRITDCKLVGGTIDLTTNFYIENLFISRSDALLNSAGNGPYDGIAYGKMGNVFLIGGPQNGVAPAFYKKWYVPSFGGNISSSLLVDYSQFNQGAEKVVWSGAATADPNNRFADVWIGRGDGIRGDSGSSATRNILGIGGTLGSLTPVGTNQAGTPTRLQGGLATGSGAPGKLEFWGGPTPGASASTIRDGSRLAYIDYTGLNLTDGPLLAEGRLSSTAAVDMNTATASTLFTCPTGKSCIITKVIVRNASTSLTTASYSFGWTGAAFNDVIANAAHTELTGATLYTVILAKIGATLGTSTGLFKVLMNTLQGGAATTTIDVYGITF